MELSEYIALSDALLRYIDTHMLTPDERLLAAGPPSKPPPPKPSKPIWKPSSNFAEHKAPEPPPKPPKVWSGTTTLHMAVPAHRAHPAGIDGVVVMPSASHSMLSAWSTSSMNNNNSNLQPLRVPTITIGAGVSRRRGSLALGATGSGASEGYILSESSEAAEEQIASLPVSLHAKAARRGRWNGRRREQRDNRPGWDGSSEDSDSQRSESPTALRRQVRGQVVMGVVEW